MASPGSIDLKSFVDSISSVDKTSFASDLERRQAVVQAEALLARLQSPRERTTKLLHTDSYLVAAVKCLVNLDLFNIWEKDGGQPKTLDQLASLTGADPALLARLLRLLVVSGMLATNSSNQYLFTDFAEKLASGRLGHSWILHSYTTSNSVVALPKYLKAHNYQNPGDSNKSPWAYNMGGQPFIEYLKSNPVIFSHINEIMKTKNMDTIPWFTFYPVEELVAQCVPQGVLLVDIGGGTGYDIETFRKHMTSELVPGQLVLQDLKQVVEEAGQTTDASIKKEAYDFFTEQPVKGARAYFMHNVLHDWPDEECRKILGRVKEAMKPGYSRLLINENVISFRSTPTACATDLSMMTVNAGAERTDVQWHELLASAGLRVTKIWMSPAVDEGLIEAEI